MIKVFNNKVNIALVFFYSTREDKDIVKIDYIEDINKALKRAINIGLEGNRGVG